MTQHLRLAELGESGQILPAKFGAKDFRAAAGTISARRQVGAASSFGRKLEDERNAGDRFSLDRGRKSVVFGDENHLAGACHHRTSAFEIADASRPNSSLRFISVTETRRASAKFG